MCAPISRSRSTYRFQSRPLPNLMFYWSLSNLSTTWPYTCPNDQSCTLLEGSRTNIWIPHGFSCSIAYINFSAIRCIVYQYLSIWIKRLGSPLIARWCGMLIMWTIPLSLKTLLNLIDVTCSPRPLISTVRTSKEAKSFTTRMYGGARAIPPRILTSSHFV